MIHPAWDRAVPDVPRWAETRSMLLQGAKVMGTPEGGVVIDATMEIAGVVGHPARQVLVSAVSILRRDAELLVTG
ncbi:MAG: hypothetical protein L0Z49_02405 [Actinobacteria bacterium]|nr:hypothetical protein [Actinomycetota bacterium]MCI0543281.1 hypothetical protein [Actinomycetota bacterium]